MSSTPAVVEKQIRLSAGRADRLSHLAEMHQIDEDQIIERALDILFSLTDLLDDQSERRGWSFLSEVKRHVGERTILGSGDLFSPADCVRMLRQTGVDGVSVARGAIGTPWIFPQVRALLSGRPLPPPPRSRRSRSRQQPLPARTG